MPVPTGEENRPSPEAMLKIARAEEAAAGLGKLKIFLGYAAGVGKTYAMLESGRKRKADGRDVVVGYVESHGRPETDALLEGLEVIPRRQINHAGVALPELDCDAVLDRRPQIVLVDELAHTNAPGSRHEKRWQDVEELLEAGINVYTTVNIQHLESLNDVVAQITGITVREKVPDRILDLAFDIKLIDIPPEDLLQRLQEGKVYVPDQVAKAVEKFFRLGNLMALRELSLRRTAARVDDQMRAYMETQAIEGPWPTAERLLVCVSGSPYSEKLIRATCRLAEGFKAEWFAIYIETPAGGRHARENREQIWRNLRLAESLGAQVGTLTAADVTDAVLDYARRHNVTKIVMGKPDRPRWRELIQTSMVDRILRRSGPIDVVVVSSEPEETALPPVRQQPVRFRNYAAALGLAAAATVLCKFLQVALAPTNMVMIYLLTVVIAAIRLGRKPAMAAALFGVLAFDFFFVPPHLSFTVADTQYLLTFVALFIVGMVISTLVAHARDRAEVMRTREVQTASLYYLSRDLAAAADISSVLKAVVKNIEEALGAEVVILLPEGERLAVMAQSDGLSLDLKEEAVADWTFRNNHAAGRSTDTLVSADLMYIPLQTPAGTLGVIGVRLRDPDAYHSQDNRRLLDAFATQAAMAMERIRLSHQAEQAQLFQARENLERALLNSISHDLRTPLVSVAGALYSLRDESDQGTPIADRKELILSACSEAERLNRFVGNLLDMTHLEAGALRLSVELCDAQDLVGCALAAVEPRMEGHPVSVTLAEDVPLVSMDLVLMTQVLVNLLENAHKYSPKDQKIEIGASRESGTLLLEVSDRGPGVPQQDLKRIFDKFYRIPVPEGAGGTGLGLSICKGIVEAHGGKISAENRPGGGLKIRVRLPIKEQNGENKP